MRLLAPLFLPVAVLAATPVFAQNAPPSAPMSSALTILSTVLTNMGYETKPSDNGKSFSVNVHGNYDLTVNFVVASSGDAISYIFLQRYNADQLSHLDLRRLLEMNDDGPGFFSLSKAEENENLYVQRFLPPSAWNPAVMRMTIDNLTHLTWTSDQVWDWHKWNK